jgi:hypothetical protein
MATRRASTAYLGIGIGAIALLMAIVHFWGGPFSPRPSLETTVAEKAVAIRNATIAALKGEEAERKTRPSDMDLDKALQVTAGTLGGLAMILGVIAFARGEPLRAAGGGVFLGAAALAFQFAVIAIGAIVIAILIAAVIPQIGIE